MLTSDNKNTEDTKLEVNDINKINSLKTIDNEEKDLVHFNKNVANEVKFLGLSDNDSICSDDSDVLPAIPDGGWGWVVVASAFLVSACADGLVFSFGILHEEFTNYFETTQSKTALIGSLFIATPLLAGPIMSALVDRYGCRNMTMIAGLVSTLGFILGSLSDSVEMLCLTFGFLSGLAMGILYVTAVVSVAFWFDKKRNLAVSLASCGMGFGTLIYSPMTSYFLQIFDWRNTMVLLAGTLLNMCVCGALMRDPDWLRIKQEKERLLRSRKSSSAGSLSSRSIGAESEILSADELKSLLKSGKSPQYILDTLATTIAEAQKLDETTKMNIDQANKRMHSVLHLPTFVQQNEKVPQEVIEKLMSNKKMYNIIVENYPLLFSVRSQSEIQLNKEPSPSPIEESTEIHLKVKIKTPKKQPRNKLNSVKEEDVEKQEQSIEKSKQVNKKGTHRHWLQKQLSTDYHYVKRMPLFRTTIMHRGAILNIPKYKLKASSMPNIYKNSNWSFSTGSDYDSVWYTRMWQITKRTFDFRMFTEFHFLMFNLSSLILSVWFIVPYFFLQSFMSANDMDGGPTMISVIGIASSIGIVVLGWAGDQPWMNVNKTYSICLIVCGISVALYPIFILNFWALTIISTIFGLSFASSYSYTPTILMELMPLDRFTVAYGLILLSQGIGHLIGPPIGGMLYDLTQTWDMTFYVGGIWLIISGICMGFIPYTQNRRMCGTAPLLKEQELADKYESDSDNGIEI